MTVHDPLLGRVLKDQYRLDAVLGRGAMGIVYRGTQLDLGKPIAVKVLLQSSYADPDARARFRREATLASKLNHPGIGQVFDFGLEGETPFLVMEYVEGKELSEVLAEEGALAPSRALVIMRQLASVLQEAQRNQLVHRDLKPSNIRLMRYTRTGPIFLKVLDFGIAKQVGGTDGKLTATGAIIGTPLYMSPEQAGLDVKQIDCRADQYAAGVIFFELLTGHPPFMAESMHALLMHHVSRPPPPLPSHLPKALRDVVMRMLAKQPDQRFADPGALDEALARCEEVCAGLPALGSGGGAAADSSGSLVKILGALGLSLLLGTALLMAFRAQRTTASPATDPTLTTQTRPPVTLPNGSSSPTDAAAVAPPAAPTTAPSTPAPPTRQRPVPVKPRKPPPAAATSPKPPAASPPPSGPKPPNRALDKDHELYQVPVLH